MTTWPDHQDPGQLDIEGTSRWEHQTVRGHSPGHGNADVCPNKQIWLSLTLFLAHASQYHLKRCPGAIPEDAHPYLGLLVSHVCASPCPGNEEDLWSKLQSVPHHWPLCPGTLWDMFNCVVCVTQRSSFHRDVEIIAFAWHQNLRTLHCLFYIRLQYNLLHNTHKSRGFQSLSFPREEILGLKLHRRVLVQLLTITPTWALHKHYCEVLFMPGNQALGDSGEQYSPFNFFFFFKSIWNISAWLF